MLLTAWNKQKETDIEIEKVFSETSGGCVIAVRNNYFIDSKYSIFRAYLVAILKALHITNL